MTRDLTVFVIADAPAPGACLPELVTSVGEPSTARLYAAVLRDTLDGFLDADAQRFVVLGPPGCEDVLGRHVHAPWVVELVAGDLDARLRHALAGAGGHAVVVARGDVPTAPMTSLAAITRHLREATAPRAAVAPRDDAGGEPGAAWLVGLSHADASPELTSFASAANAARAGYSGDALLVGDAAYAIVGLDDLNRLSAEVRSHPDRGPRCADFFVKMDWYATPF